MIAKVCPVHKNGSRKDGWEWWTMSLTSILQKTVNLIIKIKITEHIDKPLGKKISIRTG